MNLMYSANIDPRSYLYEFFGLTKCNKKCNELKIASKVIYNQSCKSKGANL